MVITYDLVPDILGTLQEFDPQFGVGLIIEQARQPVVQIVEHARDFLMLKIHYECHLRTP